MRRNVFLALLVVAGIAGVCGSLTTITYTPRDARRPKHKPTFTVTLDAAVSPVGVVAFAHGFGIDAGHYAFVADALAPLGFVVAFPHTPGAIDVHVRNASLDLALDQAFILQHLVQQSAANASSPFYSKVPNRTALMGHSLGGGTALLAADPAVLQGRYRVADALATLSLGTYTIPKALPSAARAPPSMPALLLTASQDCIDPPAKNSGPVLAGLRSACAALVSLVGGSHCQYAAPDLGCTATEKLCGARPNTTRALQQQLAMSLIAPWLQLALGSDPRPTPAQWAGSLFMSRLGGAVRGGSAELLGAARWGGCGAALPAAA
eukprot:g5726.t1